MDAFEKYDVDSGTGLMTFLRNSGLTIKGGTGLENSENIVRLPDLTTFNWKSANRIVRINCKENAMHVIEITTNLVHIQNGVGDSTRPYSFIVNSFSDLIDAVYALKTIDGNS